LFGGRECFTSKGCLHTETTLVRRSFRRHQEQLFLESNLENRRHRVCSDGRGDESQFKLESHDGERPLKLRSLDVGFRIELTAI
jgi:hypothetical protein